MDGYPGGIPTALLRANGEDTFRDAVSLFLQRKDATLPEHGWPWPWEDSRTTDYAYAFDCGKVHASCFGHDWFDPLRKEPELADAKTAVFPNMKNKTNAAPAGSVRSGTILIIG